MEQPRQRLRIMLMGGFRLLWGTTAVPLDTPSYRSLLACLVLNPGQAFTRQYLAYTIWPDSTEKQARTNLRKALYVLRRTLPEAPRFVRIDPHSVAWHKDAPFTLDVADFETAVTRAQCSDVAGERRDYLAQAIELYRGELLPDQYDEWIIVRRETLHQQYLACLKQLVQLAEDGRDYDTAATYARWLLRADPLHEAAYRSLMRLQALAGNRAGALRTYHACTARLQRELGVAPAPATQEAYQQLLKLEDLPVTPLPARVPLVGRETSWALLRSWWERATRRHAPLALIKGEAGIGKTRLAEELLDWAAQQGITTLSATCYAASGSLPYAPVADWLRKDGMQQTLNGLAERWQREVARVLPELLVEQPDLKPPEPITEHWQQQHFYTALATAVLSASQPMLLFIDNLQWCDPDTLAWLSFLLHYDTGERYLLLGAARVGEVAADHPLSTLCRELRQDGRFVECDLDRLDAETTATLAAQVTGYTLDAVRATQLFAETEGVPLFVVEMARAGLPEAARASIVPAGQSSSGVVLPSKVLGVIEERLANLSPAAQDLTALASAIGRFFTFDLLAAASEEPETVLVQALDELWQLRIIREQGAEAYDFSHDKIRRVAYTSLSNARRRWLHGHVASALEALHADNLDSISGKLATHCEAAGRTAEAIGYYRRAAEVARAVYANQEAIQCLQRAIDLFPEAAVAAQQQVEIYERLGDVLTTLSRYEEAEAVLHTAVALAEDGVLQARIYRRIANTYQLRRQFDAAFAAWQTAEIRLGSASEQWSTATWQEWLWIQLDQSWVLYWTDHTDDLEALLSKIHPIAEEHGSTVQKGMVYQRLVTLSMRRDRHVLPDETIAYARKSLAMIRQSGTQNQIAFVEFALGHVLSYRGWDGNLPEGAHHMQAALELAEEIGDVVVQLRCLVHLSQNYLRQGANDRAGATLARAKALAEKVNSLEYHAVAEGLTAWYAWRIQDFRLAQASGESALAQAKKLHFVWPARYVVFWPLISIAMMQDETGKAVEYAGNLLDPSEMRLRDDVTAVLQQAICAWDNKQPEDARAQLEQALELAQVYGYL